MATVLEVRQALVDHGYVPIPVIGKKPPFERWQKVENVSHSMLEGWRRNWPRATNTGILTRVTPTIDLDILNEPAAIAAEALIRERFEEHGYFLRRVGRPPKRAIPFRTLAPFAKLTTNFVVPAGAETEKIEFLCDGQQFVAHGIHPSTQQPYGWFGGDPTTIHYNDLPYIHPKEAQQLQHDVAALLVRDFGYVIASGRSPRKGNGTPEDHASDWQALVDGVLAGIDLHTNTRDLASKMVRAGMGGGAIVNFLRGVMNSSAAPRDERWQERYDNLPRQVDSMQAKLEREQAAVAAIAPTPAPGGGTSPPPPSPVAGATPPPPPPPPPQQTQPQPQSSQPTPQPQQRSYMGTRSRWACNLGNVVLALQREPDFVNAFGYDEMLCMNTLLRPLFKTDPTFKPRPLTDVDVLAVQDWLQWHGFRRLGTETTQHAISKCARDNSYHPVRNYLNGLKWDGKSRLGTWLHDCLGAAQNEYTKKIGIMFLISMVARIYQPGCKADYMLVLEHAQGYQKSLACETLAGEYFDDHMPENIASKEASQHLRGKWLIEWAEMRAYTRAEANATKAFLTRTVERYRPSYGHNEVVEPRQCIFIGTTNKATYLTDETGNRRIWPVKCNELNLEALRRDRDQLFAEAVKLYRDGVQWWPDRELEAKYIEPQQADRFEADAWEQPIFNYLDGKIKITIIDIAVDVLGYEREPPSPPVSQGYYGQSAPVIRGTPINRLAIRDQGRISAILVHLGWESKRNDKERWWQPKS